MLGSLHHCIPAADRGHRCHLHSNPAISLMHVRYSRAASLGCGGAIPTPCGYLAHLLPHHCCPHQALLSQTCRVDPMLGTQHAALPALLQQTSERLKLESPSPPSPPVQVTAASAARQQSCLPSFATFPSRRPGSTWNITNNHSADQGAEDGTPGYDSSASLSRRKTARLDQGRTPGAPLPPSPHR